MSDIKKELSAAYKICKKELSAAYKISEEQIDKFPNKSTVLSYGVLVFSISIVLLCCVPIIFPALIQSITSEFSEFAFYTPQVDPFEIGALAVPFVIVNLSILLIGIIYYKKHLSLNRFFNFDVSNKIALTIVGVILSIYIILTLTEFSIQEPFNDFSKIEWIVMEQGVENLQGFHHYVKLTLLTISVNIFGDMRVIPFIGSIGLLVTTFFISKEITQKRIPGIIAMVLVLQSNIFLTYDTSATYSNFWILFYVLSIYLILKKWKLSHISFILSVFSKSLSGIFLPFTIFFVLNNTKGKKRIYLLIFYIILIIGGIFAVTSTNILFGASTYHQENFLKGFIVFSYQLIHDPIILIFLLPLTIGLFLKSLKGFHQANSIQILISGILLTTPLVVVFTSHTNEPYRLIPLVVFFAIGVATLFGKIKQDES